MASTNKSVTACAIARGHFAEDAGIKEFAAIEIGVNALRAEILTRIGSVVKRHVPRRAIPRPVRKAFRQVERIGCRIIAPAAEITHAPDDAEFPVIIPGLRPQQPLRQFIMKFAILLPDREGLDRHIVERACRSSRYCISGVIVTADILSAPRYRDLVVRVT